MKRVLLLPTTGYRNDDFLAAAKKLGRSLARVGRTRQMDFPIARWAAAYTLLVLALFKRFSDRKWQIAPPINRDFRFRAGDLAVVHAPD